MIKLWLVGMSGSNSLENLKELWDPIKHDFSGIVWTLHDSVNSEEAKYLEENKKDGKVIHYYYNFRHNESRNQYLFCGPIKENDWCVQLDDLERLNPLFVQQIPALIQNLEGANYNATYFFGKVFMFKYHESMRYDGTPHEGFNRLDGQLRGVELNSVYKEEKDARYNVRAEKRQDKWHWLWHYLKYYIASPYGSNHVLLGNENRPEMGSPIDIYHKREKIRLQFRKYLVKRGIELTVEGFKNYLISSPHDTEMIAFCNVEKITNDVYRYLILRDETISDQHHWKDLKKII